MANITYLLGAGASFGIERKIDLDSFTFDKTNYLTKFGGLPIVKEVGKKLERLQFFLHHPPQFNNYQTTIKSIDPSIEPIKVREYPILIEELTNEIDEFCNTVNLHASFDTLARKYYLLDDSKLDNLKFIIDLLFCVEQLIEVNDRRYDLFFSTIFNKAGKGKINRPSNIHIINWNYDIQIEYSLSYFYPEYEDLEQLRKKLNIFGPQEVNNANLEGDFSIIKLNGSAGNKMALKDFIKKDQKSYLFIFDFILKYYKSFKSKGYVNDICFAWESNSKKKIIACEILKNSDILVIIGYSFPTFNRETDRELIQSFLENRKLFIRLSSGETFDSPFDNNSHLGETNKKIIIQAPANDINNIISRLTALLPKDISLKENEIIEITSTEEFYIPPEFDDRKS